MGDQASVQDYTHEVEELREAKDQFFATSDHSPIPADERRQFHGLSYFEVDPRYRIEGLRLAPYVGDEPAAFAIPTSDGQLRPARRLGRLEFVLDGQSYGLTAYGLEGGNPESLFVPFLDGTSGSESYEAGRYLDIEPEVDGTYVLDFNLAYHPYCVYSPYYSCPLTPSENLLARRIDAGEQLGPHDDGHGHAEHEHGGHEHEHGGHEHEHGQHEHEHGGHEQAAHEHAEHDHGYTGHDQEGHRR